jgi:putative ABC transport system permease protein
MTQVVFGSVAPVAGVAAVLGALGFGALLLAALGIYGVVSFSVRQRTHEIGVRMALGASVGQVVRLVLKQGFVLVAIGLAMGVVLVAGPTLVAERLGAKGLLQPWALLASTLILSAAGLGAAYLPARRAARVEPSVALRHE